MHKERIVIVCSRLDLQGGIERASVNLANLFAENGHDIILLILDVTPEVFYPLHQAVRVVHQNLHFGITPAGNVFTRKVAFLSHTKALRHCFLQLQPDIIISTEYALTIPSWLAARGANAKVIGWEHHHFHWLKKSRFWAILFRFVYPRLHTVVCQNTTEKKLFAQIGCTATVIPYVIPQQKKPARLDAKTILTIGWLIKRKGVDLIPAVAAQFLKKHPDWRWKIIGEGEEEASLREGLRTFGLVNQVVIQKPVSPQIEEEYRNASVLVMLSRFECLPLVMLEAMTVGLPCVAFDCPTGPADIIRQRQNGFLLPQDDAAGMAAAIEELIENEALRKQLGRQAYESSVRYAPVTIYARWMELFAALKA